MAGAIFEWQRNSGLIAILICLVGAPVFADEISCELRELPIYSGFLSGEQFLSLNKREQSRYAAGFFDGIFASVSFGAAPECEQKLIGCLSGRTDTQMAAIFETGVRARPEAWHLPMTLLGERALAELCDLAASQEKAEK